MATTTSLYLCNRTVYAAVGKPGAKKVRISAFCQADLPEGCMINGVITNEAALTAGLREFLQRNALPTRRVALILNGTQFQHKLLTLPSLNQKRMYRLISREMAAAGSETPDPLDDYMLLRHQKNNDLVLATRVEKSTVDAFMALCQNLNLNVTSIDTGLACMIKLVERMPVLAGKTFIHLQFDGENMFALLFEKGAYRYSTRGRLFNRRGTPEFGAEMMQKLSGIVQFHAANKSENQITNVTFGGCSQQDLDCCRSGCEVLNLAASFLPECPGTVQLPAGCRLGDAAFLAGNLIER